MVVWDRNLYLQEADRQLSDTSFYEKLDRDFTLDYNKTICAVVKEAITKGELPASAINLIVDNPRTSSFYMLPKIHKPGNLGRPIVSACNCPTELIATYLDVITTPLVQSLPSYVKDTNHMLRIADSFRFPGTSNYVFTMDVKSLYTVIPNGDGLLALTHFLNKRPVLQPPTHTLVRLAELVLTLNTFSFNGNFYRQTGGVAMGSRLGPNYACLFMGHVEEQIFAQYTGTKPALYKRYIDDIVGATSGSREEIEVFANYVNGFHPSLKFTWIISVLQLPFLDLCLKPVSDRLLTSIHYKDTDTHSYLYYTSSHPARCKNSIPYSQFLRLRRICSEDNDFENKRIEMASFFRNRDYPSNVIQRAQERVSAIPRHALISERSDVPDAQPTIPLVLTYHPTNALIKNIMTRNFHLLRDDPDTRDIYEPVRILCSYRRDINLRDSLVRSHLNTISVSGEDRGTFPCGRSRCNTCTHTNASPTINTPGGCITITSRYTCISQNVVYVIKCCTCNKIYIGETGRRLGDRFREHLRSTRQANTDLPVGRHFASPSHACTDMLVSVIRSGFRDAQDRRRFEARMIFKHKTLHPGGLNTDFAFL